MKPKNTQTAPASVTYDPNKFPNPEMIHVLKTNKVKVHFKTEGADLLLWCDFSHLTKVKKGEGLEVWGRAQNIIEHISRTVFAFYPHATITSQNGNSSLVYRLNS
jgi:hypothetical protein